MIDIEAEFVIAVSERVLGKADTLLSRELLHSALSSYQYYDTDMLCIASVYRGLIKNHAFQDGNKRTATLVLSTLLIDGGIGRVSNTSAVKLALDIATSNYSVEQVAERIAKALGSN